MSPKALKMVIDAVADPLLLVWLARMKHVLTLMFSLFRPNDNLVDRTLA